MANDFEMIKNIGAIYRCAFFHNQIHKNTMRNQLIFRKKISTKNRFYQAFDRLVANGGIIKDKEMVSINPEIVKLGYLKEMGNNEFYVVMPETNKKYRISKSVASSYSNGDPLHVVIESISGSDEAIVLGKNYGETFSSYKERNATKLELTNPNLALGRVLKLSHDELVFIPNKKSFATRQIPILNSSDEQAAFQDKLCVMELVDVNAPLLGGKIVEIKGDAGNPIHEFDAIAESYGAIMSWEGESLEKEIAKIPNKVNIADFNLISEAEAKRSHRGNIVDLRHINFTTVDPATCKDMDDAIYSTVNENGDIVCYIAVANVTKYFDLNSEIGKKYIEGGFTIYAPNKAYNILPTQLSTGICSLNPNEDRLAFVVKFTVDKTTGSIKRSRIYDAVIQSKKKYAYQDAQNIVDENKDVTLDELTEKIRSGQTLSEEEQVVMNCCAGKVIKQGFESRKMIRFFASKEREIKFDEDLQNIEDIVPLSHLYYHEVIEAFMISANEVTAKYAKDNNLDNIYRVHDEPNPHKIERANEFFDILGIEFDGDLSAEGTRDLLEIVKDGANEEVVNNFLIKMQSRAVYSDHLYSNDPDDEYVEWEGERISHYALQSPHYSHTTSPIRRVPDYITQYNILADIHGTSKISLNKIQKIVDIANSRQLAVDQAEKDFEDINSVIYCEQHIGEKMHGRITKLRATSPEEGFEDDIIVIVKEDSKGISAEIPLSQVIGRNSSDCELSPQRCAVYDGNGNIILALCKPIDFIIEKADRKAMRVIGKTDVKMVSQAEMRETTNKKNYIGNIIRQKEKKKRDKRRKDKQNHKKDYDYEDSNFK